MNIIKNIQDFKTEAEVQVELDMIYADLSKWTSDEGLAYTKKLWTRLFDLRALEAKKNRSH